MEQTGLVFRPFLNAWVAAGLAAAVVALSALAYRRTTREVPARLKLVLLALRAGAALALLVCLLRPSMETTQLKVVKRPLVLLIDQSRSMRAINDTARGLSRLAAVDELLEQNAARLDALRELYDVMVLGFGKGLLGRSGVQDASAAGYSAYGMALEQAFREATDGQCDAIAIVGDGAHNYGPPDPVDVAASLNELGVPVYTVGVGQGRAGSDLRDVKVAALDAPKTAFLFTTFPVRPQLLFRGCKGVPVQVRLEFPGLPTQERTVTPAHDEELVPLSFDLTPERVGEHRVVVRAGVVEGEILESNNQMTAYVKVVSGGVRVGFFDSVRPESKFIARGLTGAEHVSMRRVLTLSGGLLDPAATDPSRYDAFIVGDVSATSLRATRQVELRDAVLKEGKGLVVLLTERSAGPSGWRGTPLEPLLPVRLPDKAAPLGGEHPFRPEPEHADNPVLLLADDVKESNRLWAEMPPLAGMLAGVEPKRGATVLATDGQGNPVLVVHRAGEGRVACLTVDTTFRWFFTQENTQDLHRRFWRQMVMWAAGREKQPPGKVRLELSNQRLALGEKLKVTLTLREGTGEAVRDADVQLDVTNPLEETAALAHAFSRSEEAYVAEYAPTMAGDYTVTAHALRGEEPLGTDVAHFGAANVDVELEDPAADLGLLRRIAAATADSGGRYFHYGQAVDLFDELQRRGKPLQLTTRQRRDVWDAYPLFIIFAACVAAEWGLRKWKGLL